MGSPILALLQGGLDLYLVEQEAGHHQTSQDELLLIPGEGRLFLGRLKDSLGPN